jgi:Mad3/BUB1 homology region 1
MIRLLRQLNEWMPSWVAVAGTLAPKSCLPLLVQPDRKKTKLCSPNGSLVSHTSAFTLQQYMSQLMFQYQAVDMCISPHRDAVCMTEFEHQKENIQPVKAGRNPQALKKVFGLHESTAIGTDMDKTALSYMNHNRDAMLKAARFDWENKLGACVQLAPEDPLRIWLQYLQWIEENYPSLGPDSKYTEILEQCSRLFSSDEQRLSHYRNDTRFIRRVWLCYADRTPGQASLDIYNFMFQRAIGMREA